MKHLVTRLGRVEAGHDESAYAQQLAYLLVGDAVLGQEDCIRLNGQHYTVEEFCRRFPHVDVTRIKAYGSAPGFDPEDI